MRGKTRKLSFCALMCAFSVAAMFLASVIPVGRLGIVGIACFFTIAAVIEAGKKGGLAVYVCSAFLSFLLVPVKGAPLIYTVFFGYYPIVKSFAEKRKSRVLEWVIKIAVLNAAATLLLFVFKGLIYDFVNLDRSIWLIILAFNVVFVIFDIGVSMVIDFYMERISDRVRKN
ncbi:MAG: hypothetical protein IJG63_00305 [Oscillospiraceae bacterium]|nr:hypothetical protein [Oscillospiraceae bacterium]